MGGEARVETRRLGVAVECLGEPEEGVFRLVEVRLQREGAIYHAYCAEEWGAWGAAAGARYTHGWGTNLTEAAAGALWNAPRRMDRDLLRRALLKAIALATGKPEAWQEQRRRLRA